MSFLLDVATSVVANLVFWVLLGAVFFLLVRVTQKDFRTFFGFDRKATLVVCLSNLWQADTSFRPRGYVISLHELKASEAVSGLFGSASFRLPELVRGLVDAMFLGSSRYEFRTSVSTAETDDVRAFPDLGANLIVIGGAMRNQVRRLYLDENRVTMHLSTEQRTDYDTTRRPDAGHVEITRGPETGRNVEAAGYELAVVERIRDDSRGTEVFFCLGEFGSTTWAAAEFLVRNWRALAREFGDRPFALCLGFRGQHYSWDYQEPQRLFVS